LSISRLWIIPLKLNGLSKNTKVQKSISKTSISPRWSGRNFFSVFRKEFRSVGRIEAFGKNDDLSMFASSFLDLLGGSSWNKKGDFKNEDFTQIRDFTILGFKQVFYCLF
jgi:hypothetical protein